MRSRCVCAALALLLAIGGIAFGADDYRHKSLSDARFDGQDLSKAKLSYLVISDASFAGANLSKADLRYSVASDASFEKADLRDARIGYCVMTDADFRQADCRGASFGHTLLTDADFRGADLRGADFREARLGGQFDETTLYNEHTGFPAGFDPRERGLTLRSDAPPPPAVEESSKVQPSATFEPVSSVRIKAVADIWPGEEGSYPAGMLEYRDEVYFRARLPESRQGCLCRFDGRRMEPVRDLASGEPLAQRLSGNLLRRQVGVGTAHSVWRAPVVAGAGGCC